MECLTSIQEAGAGPAQPISERGMGRRYSNRRPVGSGSNPGRKEAGIPADRTGAGTGTVDEISLYRAAVRRARTAPGLLAVCGLLLLAVGLVFGQTAGFGFVNWTTMRASMRTGWSPGN